MSDITLLLDSVAHGDARAAEDLLPIVYSELRRLAAHKMAGESAGHTLQATALVHEAWMRLVGSDQKQWQNRSHFFAAAAEAMRRILVEHARRKQSLKRGGGIGIYSGDCFSMRKDILRLRFDPRTQKSPAQAGLFIYSNPRGAVRWVGARLPRA